MKKLFTIKWLNISQILENHSFTMVYHLKQCIRYNKKSAKNLSLTHKKSIRTTNNKEIPLYEVSPMLHLHYNYIICINSNLILSLKRNLALILHLVYLNIINLLFINLQMPYKENI